MSEERIITRADMVREADEWLNTPWVHQQSVKGVAADCLGFLRGMARFVGHSDLPFEAYNRVADERQEGAGWRMIELLDAELDRLPTKYDARVGDWFTLLNEHTGLPQHVAMVRRYEDGQWQVIHATAKDGVRYNRLDRRTLRTLVFSAYHVPGVVD